MCKEGGEDRRVQKKKKNLSEVGKRPAALLHRIRSSIIITILLGIAAKKAAVEEATAARLKGAKVA